MLMKVVLGDPRTVKAVTLSVADLLCRQAIALFGRGVIQ
jgi:hypothetical protein